MAENRGKKTARMLRILRLLKLVKAVRPLLAAQGLQCLIIPRVPDVSGKKLSILQKHNQMNSYLAFSKVVVRKKSMLCPGTHWPLG